MNQRRQLEPNTTLFPVPVVLITAGAGTTANVFTLNRIASCNAEPPMLSISVRRARASHDLIRELGEFVVNVPPAGLEHITDFVGATTGRETAKWDETGLVRLPASVVQPPLLADCPVNLECRVVETVTLPSHTLFIGEVVALHAVADILDARGEVDLVRFSGMTYRASVVRERPVDSFRPAALLQRVRNWRDRQET